jgi:5-methylcytosine-specific restriction enzyme A
MATAAPKPCLICRALVHDGTTRCSEHKVVAGSFADRQRGSRHERGYGSAWDKTRARILRRDAGICQACLKDGHVHRGTEVDHKVPKAEGGSEDDDNLQTICASAHRAKTVVEAQRARGVTA